MTYEPESPYIPRIKFGSDSHFCQVTQETLVANTNKELTIPVGSIGVHIYPTTINAVIFFRLDAAATVQTTNVPVLEGFFPPLVESARTFFNEPSDGTHKFNMISAGAGNLLVEFWG
jgi:hypothetical protein